MSPRLFVAIRPPAEIRAILLAAMGSIAAARWQDDGQLHLTLRFCGEVEPRCAEELVDALLAIRFAPFEVALHGIGAFAKRGRVHTLYASAIPSPELSALQRKVERTCIAVGLPPADHGFVPHVTLARLMAASGPLDPFMAREGGRDFGRWKCDSFALFESHLRPEGSLYQPVRIYRAATRFDETQS